MTSTVPSAASLSTATMPMSTVIGGHVYGGNLGPLTSVFSAPSSCINPSNIWVSEYLTTIDSTTTETFELFITSTCAPSADAAPCYPPNFRIWSMTDHDNGAYYYSPASECPRYYTTQTTTVNDYDMWDRKGGEVGVVCCPSSFYVVDNYWDVHCTYSHQRSTGKTDSVTATNCDGRRDVFSRGLEIYAPAIHLRYQLSDIKPGFTGVTPTVSTTQTTAVDPSVTGQSSTTSTCGSGCGGDSSAARLAIGKLTLGFCLAHLMTALFS